MTGTSICDLERMRFEFFAWASARAAQAGSSKTTVSVLRGALVDADAANWHRTIAVTSAKDYDAWHIGTIDGVHRKLVSTAPAIGWGIAAKLVNVFIKGRWLLDPGYVGPMRAFGHPAIDSIQLRIIDDSYGTDFSRSVRWHRMNRQEYAGVIVTLRQRHPHEAIWTIEEGWSADRKRLRTQTQEDSGNQGPTLAS